MQKWLKGNKKGNRFAVAIVLFLIVAIAGAFSLFQYVTAVTAGVTAPKILIISNDDTYVPNGYTAGTSATNMASFLSSVGYNVTVHTETTNGAINASFVGTADTYDLVIFTQGVGYRSTNNNKNGLDSGDLAFLKEYLNITNTIAGTSKANLIIEGEDVFYDIGRVGVSTDQRDILKVNTSGTTNDRGRITQLKINDTTHPINAGLPLTASTSYQSTWQDSVSATTGAKVVTNSTISSRDYGSVVTFDDGNGNRRVFMPFSWYMNGSNLISNQAWRETFLANAVKWVGESKVTVTANTLAPTTIAPSTTKPMLKATLSSSWGDSGVSGLNITESGSATGAVAIDQVMVYDDVDNDGLIDGGEPVLGQSSTWNNEVCTVTFDTPLNISLGSSKNLIIAYQLNSGNTDFTVGASLVDSNSVIIYPSDYLAKVYGSFPFDSNLSYITTAGTTEFSTPQNNATIRGSYNVTGTASGEYYLEYAPGYDSSGPWTVINHGMSAVYDGALGAWNTNALTDGNYTLKLRVLTGTSRSINVAVDNASPVVSTGPVVVPGTTKATVTWTTDEPSTSEVVYKPVSGGSWVTDSNQAFVQNHSMQIGSLSSATAYNYYVQSTDVAGNTVVTATYSFTTEQRGAYAHIDSPVEVGQVIPRIGGMVAIKGSAKTDRTPDGNPVNWSLSYGVGDNQASVSVWNEVYSHNLPVENGTLYNWNTNGLSNGAYMLKLRATDPGITGATAVMEHYVAVIVDNSLPVISNVKTINTTNVSADVSWETNKATTDQVLYGTTSGIYPNSLDDGDGDNRVFVPSLTPNTTYYYRVHAMDTTGHEVDSGEYTFTTTNVVDQEVPSMVYADLIATGRTDTTVDIAWKPGFDNTGISAYRIYRSQDGSSFSMIGTVNDNTQAFRDTGLNASTEYWYRVTALDLAGNQSVPSNTIKVPTVAVFRVNPHGSYPDNTDMCGKCHTPHRGLKSNLFKDSQEAKVCYSCHNGTGSKYNIQGQYDPGIVSRHPLPINHTGKECASCHNPHLSASGTPKLLSATIFNAAGNKIGSASSGNQFCYACHGDVEVDKVIFGIGGSHAPFENSVHNDSDFPLPASGSKIKCIICHNNHSSNNVRLTKAVEEESCYRCHGDTTASAVYGLTVNIKAKFTKMSHHLVENNGANNTRIECVSCHNPHFITQTDRTSDPYDTNDVWIGDRSTFCLRCHDGDATPSKMVSDTKVVPYDVKMPALNQTTANYNGTNGGWDKSGFTDTQAAHYSWNSSNRVHCDKCHDPHGSDNKRLMARPEDTSTTGAIGECASCHSTGGQWRGTYSSAPEVYTQMDTGVSKHPTLTNDSSVKHSDTEDYANIPVASRHAECWDCHDPHVARRTGTKVGNVSGPLFNVSGVARNTTTGAVYFQNIISEDWMLCYKCHSSYWNNLDSAGKRNIAAEFYRTTGNRSYHFVELNNPGYTPNLNGKVTGTDKDGNPWTNTSKMYCQDCHGAPTGAKGPHGSPYPSVLKGTFDLTITIRNQPSTFICFRCHQESWYESVSNHGRGVSEHNVACMRCHGSQVHGSSRRNLIRPNNTTVATNHIDYENKAYVTSGTSGDPTWNSKSSCSTSCGGHN